MSVSMMNLRPVVLLPYGAAEPGELNCASPSSLRGPSHAQWTPLGASRHYAGQMAVVAAQQQSFKRAFKTYYLKRLMLNHNMAVTGKDQFSVNDVVMICDLSSSQGQNPHPVVGRIREFVDDLNAQAVIAYGDGRTVDRPLASIVRLVTAEEQGRNKEGILIDPFIQEDIALEEEQQEGDVRPPGPAPARLQEQQQQQEGDVRPRGLSRPAQAQQQQQHGGGDGGDDGGGHTVGQTVLKERAYGGEHRVQEGDGEDAGEDAGDPGADAGEDPGKDAGDAGEDAGDAGADAGKGAGEDGEEKQEERQEGDHATVEAVIASQGWRGGRRHPPRIRRKISKF